MSDVPNSSSTGVGRPKSLEKRAAILAAARELMLEHGYSRTSMEMIATTAGVGKPTVYNHFGSKKELFDAIVEVRRTTVLETLGVLRSPSHDVRSDLEAFAVRFQETVITDESQRWARLVIGESGRHPELAQTLFRSGPAHVLGLLARYLESQSKLGRVDVDDPSLAAEHLLGLITGFDLLRGLMAVRPRRTERDRWHRARAAVSTFLAAYGSRSEGRSP